MSYSDDYEFNPGEEDNVAPEPPGYMYPVIDGFEEQMLQKRLLELIPPPGEDVKMDRDFLELTPDYAQPFMGALIGIREKEIDTEGKDGEAVANAKVLDLASIIDALGTHLLIGFYVAKVYKLDINQVIEESMKTIENLHAEDMKLTRALEKMNMTPGGSVIVDSATEDMTGEWPDAPF